MLLFINAATSTGIKPSLHCSVGRPKHQKVMMGGLEEADVYIGRKAQELRGLLKIKYPVEHGIVSLTIMHLEFAESIRSAR